MFAQLSPLFGEIRSSRTHGRRRRTSDEIVAAIESLETRQLLAGAAAPLASTAAGTPTASPGGPVSFDPVSGILTLNGDNGVNRGEVKIYLQGLNYRLVATMTSGGQTFQGDFAAWTVRHIEFQGFAGDDVFYNFTSIGSTAWGGDGKDTLSGGQSHDFLYGDGNNDTLYGGLGNDYIDGGTGNDTIFGHEGSDFLLGGSDHDTISDYAFDDGDSNIINGGSGNDVISGYGTESLVEISGGTGKDTITAFGKATVFGNEGDDTIYGSTGDDMLYGGDGKDSIFANDGHDFVNGGTGDDVLRGGAGHDSLLGFDGVDWIFGEDGNDFVHGGDHDDRLYGGNGNDGIFGGDGADNLYGGNGDDVLAGGHVQFRYGANGTEIRFPDISDWNTDYLYGEAGSDTFHLADKKLPYWWLDHAEDDTSADQVNWWDWTSFPGAFDNGKFGHTYRG